LHPDVQATLHACLGLQGSENLSFNFYCHHKRAYKIKKGKQVAAKLPAPASQVPYSLAVIAI
jgi:hypothetical protein